jgi:sugar phosphate isomerase/epimerase
MKFAICNETFIDWPHEKAFAFAAECGYTGIELAPFTLGEPGETIADVRDVSAARRETLKGMIAEAGLEVVGLHWLLAKTSGFHLTTNGAAVRKTTTEYFAQLARLCHDLGGKIMVLGSPQQRNLSPDVSEDQGMEHAAEVLRGFMPLCEDLNVTVALEPLGAIEGNFLNTAAKGVELIEMVASSHCRLHLDCKAMSSETDSIPTLIHRHQDHLAHFHANDPNRMGPGFGELEFVPIVQALGEIDYRGWVSVEVFDYTPGPEALAKESIEHLLHCLEEAKQA